MHGLSWLFDVQPVPPLVVFALMFLLIFVMSIVAQITKSFEDKLWRKGLPGHLMEPGMPERCEAVHNGYQCLHRKGHDSNHFVSITLLFADQRTEEGWDAKYLETFEGPKSTRREA